MSGGLIPTEGKSGKNVWKKRIRAIYGMAVKFKAAVQDGYAYTVAKLSLGGGKEKTVGEYEDNEGGQKKSFTIKTPNNPEV